MTTNITDKKRLRIDETFGNLIKSNTLGGLLLIVFTIISLVWANSPWKESYHQIWHTSLSFQLGNFKFDMHLLHWINDLLMAVFFYLVGLEIKREIYSGELSSLKKAALPALGALGGMVVPAVLYVIMVSFSTNEEAIKGWGIPMATDIAFSLGIISLLGKRVPLALKVFLAAFAIVDDLGAIFVIAFFYTEEVKTMWLIIGLSVIILLFTLNRLNFRIIPFYHIAGIFVWFCFHESGIHATIAGVLLAFTIPITRKLGVIKFKKMMREIQIIETGDSAHTLSIEQIRHIHHLEKQISRIQSPVQRLEHSMHNTVNYLILPLFVLANAGVTIVGTGNNSFSIISIAIGVGLVVGKTIGISLFAWIGCKLGITQLPAGVGWKHLIGIAVLGGLGFTMSIFISNLAFTDEALLGQAKSGILLGSIISGIVGYYILNRLFPVEYSKENTLEIQGVKSN